MVTPTNHNKDNHNMMNLQELAAWSAIPFSGPAERISAYADPQYHSIHGEAFRHACHVKDSLSLPANAPTIERPLTISLGGMSIGENTQTLEDEVTSNPFAKTAQVNESRLGLSLSGNQAAA